MNKKGYTDSDEEIARFAKALGHPARIAILKFLASEPSCYFGELNDIVPLTKATVSQHLAELKDAGLIKGQFEPPKVRYCINPESWERAKILLETMFNSYNKEQKCCK
ncbi:MAG: winged helix-turn-helix domain-containing protein [Rikenellaceae bacterium]